ncbi:LacI family DNA-binding transcriptional regulator [Bacillus sp. FJAT-50079]|uniref:LacI family DNA-binding transcriptional regulator n=1 Tax=Bacillus sp. FJAT-50079 TaxID=2833577 RepID=UPI001BC9BD3E|nr:LacI family DNA-binding transcriptional regulator [Bacillus sp. FJAT-50079]MBS4208154.1 LacI family DNA-binding transcriptional regulator [Bacillus sp. FJAT-50079]
MVTMKDVANMANVSVATVSRYINNSGYVSEDARIKVQKAIEKLKYSPNEVARSLYQKQSKFIGLLLPDITNPFFTLLAKGAEDRLNESDYALILCNVQDDFQKAKEYTNIFQRNNVAGIISAIEFHDELIINIPFVAIDRITGKEEYVVYSDDYQGGVLAAEAITKRNAKEILILSGPSHLIKSKERLQGMLSVLNECNVKYHLYEVPSYRLKDVDSFLNSIFIEYPNIDSIIASNDLHALATLKKAAESGIRIPEEVQIIGYDDIEFSELSFPGLSTISQPIYEMGKVGADLLLKLVNNKRIEKKKIKLPVKFIERDTLRKEGGNE